MIYYTSLNAKQLMQRRFEYAEKLRLEAGESPLAKKLRAQGLIK